MGTARQNERGHAGPLGLYRGGLALQQFEDRLLVCIGLSQHGCRSLLNDLRARQLRAGFGVICIQNSAARLSRVVGDVVQVVNSVLETVDLGAQIGAKIIDGCDCTVHLCQGRGITDVC